MKNANSLSIRRFGFAFSAIFLVFMTVLCPVEAGCKLKDIMSIMGGSYTINHVTANHVNIGKYPYLVVAGKLTNTDGVSKGFMYALEYNMCKLVNNDEIGDPNL